jgi:hypothetical protein
MFQLVEMPVFRVMGPWALKPREWRPFSQARRQ